MAKRLGREPRLNGGWLGRGFGLLIVMLALGHLWLATPVAGLPQTAPATQTCVGLTETFDGFPLPSAANGTNWEMLNRSSPAPNPPSDWGIGNPAVFAAQAGAPGSYIAVNYESSGSPGVISNWLLTPMVTLQTGATLSFWTRAGDPGVIADRLEVRLSASGAVTDVGTTEFDVGVFSTALVTVNPTLTTTGGGAYPDVWTPFSVTVTGLPNPTSGRIAFRYFTPNDPDHASYVGVDSVQFTCADAPTATPTATTTPTVTRTPTVTGTPPTPTACVALTENFDGAAPPPGWESINRSNPVGAFGWFKGVDATFAAQAGAADSYVAANFQNTAYTGAISSWLLTPPVTLQNGATVAFFSRTNTGAYPDRLQLRLSLSGGSNDVGVDEFSVGAFTTQLVEINPTLTITGYPTTWTQYSATISGLPSPVAGRFAFRYFVTNAGQGGLNSDYLGVDTFSYTCVGQATATPTRTPTPAATATPTATATPSPTSSLGALAFIQPVRVVDTRAGFGPIGFDENGAPITAGQLPNAAIRRYRFAGQTFGGATLPTNTTGVLINVTLVQPNGGGGYVTVYPGHVGAAPTAATVLPPAPEGVTIGVALAYNFWSVGLAPPGGPNGGTIAVTSLGDPRDIIIDLVGYYSPANPTTLGELKFITPARVLDTRAAFGPIGVTAAGAPVPAGPIAPNAVNRYKLAGQTFGSAQQGNLITFPNDVSGVLAHITTVQSVGTGGYTTLLPGDATAPINTSTLNPIYPIAFNSWAMGLPRNVGAGVDGTFGVFSTQSLDVIVDVMGYFAPSNVNTVGALNLVNPARVVDTRAGFGPIGFDENGAPITAGLVPNNALNRYRLNGKSFANNTLTVPSDAKGALVNVTIIQPGGAGAGGYVTLFPGDAAAAPTTATVNPTYASSVNQTFASSWWASGVPTAPAPNPGAIGLASFGSPRDVVIDLVGYFR